MINSKLNKECMINRCWSSQFREVLQKQMPLNTLQFLILPWIEEISILLIGIWYGCTLGKWQQVDMFRYWRQPNIGYRNMVSKELFAEIEDGRRGICMDSSHWLNIALLWAVVSVLDCRTCLQVLWIRDLIRWSFWCGDVAGEESAAAAAGEMKAPTVAPLPQRMTARDMSMSLAWV
jgi:hypothetical protein